MNARKKAKSGATKEEAIELDSSISDTESSEDEASWMAARFSTRRADPRLLQIVQSTENEPLDAPDSLPDLSGIIDENLGYAVIPFPAQIRERFQLNNFLSDQREFIRSDPEQLFVLGGFGAMANPSSYHHPERRKLMNDVYAYMEPIFRRTFQNSPYQAYRYLSMIPDRFGIRRAGQEVGAETWHKDQSMSSEQAKSALVFGGWINLNSNHDTYFSCVPADVVLPHDTPGFYERQLQRKGGFTADKDHQRELNTRRVRIRVPPNHLIVFNELLTHEVVKAVATEPFSYRCYLKWFVSKNDGPYWPEARMHDFFEKQSQIGMSQFQPDAPMFASAHSSYSAGAEKLAKFSEGIIPQLRTFEIKGEKVKKSGLVTRFIGKEKGEKRKGLVDWGVGFATYTELEKSIYIPRLMY